jgi:hypothetical protein
MMKPVLTVLLLAVLTSSLATAVVYAQECLGGGGSFGLYFDQAGTQRYMDPGPPGSLVRVYVFGEGFEADVPFVSGVQFCVDYGPNLELVADIFHWGVFIGGTSDCYRNVPGGPGLSLGFGLNPQYGDKFQFHEAICMWTNDCSAGQNVDGPIVREHPLFPDPCPLVSRFPDQAVFDAFGARSQTCQLVELDIHPGSCPNPYNIKLFDWANDKNPSPSVLPTAILGSETVDVNDIDPATLMLEGVPALRHSYEDVATLDGHEGCDCNDGDADGYMDMTVKFNRQAIAMALLLENPPHTGQMLPLTLTGAYWDGMPFEATDCITLVGNAREKKQTGLDGASALGFPTPNPFNPVTRISYNVSLTQHVRIAIYDVAGRLVETLVDETKSAGEYAVEWDAGGLPSGVYFYRMETGDQTIVRRATLLK